MYSAFKRGAYICAMSWAPQTPVSHLMHFPAMALAEEAKVLERYAEMRANDLPKAANGTAQPPTLNEVWFLRGMLSLQDMALAGKVHLQVL